MGNDAHCAAWIAARRIRRGGRPAAAAAARAARRGTARRRPRAGAGRSRRAPRRDAAPTHLVVFTPVRAARAVRARHDRARGRAAARRRPRLGLRRPRHLRALPGRGERGRAREARDHLGGRRTSRRSASVEQRVRGRPRPRARAAGSAAPPASRGDARDRRAAREPGAPPGRAQGGRRASDRGRSGRAALLRRGARSPTSPTPTSDLGRLREALEREWGLDGPRVDAHASLLRAPRSRRSARRRPGRVTVAVHDGADDHRRSGPGFHDARATASPSTSARRPSRGTSATSHTGDGARVGRRDEPADPLRRGPDEPRLLRDDEPRLREGADARPSAAASRSSPPSSRSDARRSIARRHPRDHARRQPDHAPPPPRARPDRARRRAVRARGRRGGALPAPRPRPAASTRVRAPTCCRASPATSAPTRPA